MSVYKVIYDDVKVLYDPVDPDLQLLSAELTNEAGKSGEFTFSIAPYHVAYTQLKPLKTKIKVFHNNKMIFSGRILNYSRDMYGIKTVCCEGELSYLVDSVQRPYKFNGYPIDLLTQYINQHNEQVEEGKRFVIGDTSAFPVIDPSKIPQPNVTYTYSYVTKRRLEMYGSDSTESRIVGWIPEGKTVNMLGGGTNGLTYVSYNGQSGYAPSSGIQRMATVAGTTQAENPYYINVEASTYEKTLDAINTNIVDAFGGFLNVRHQDGVMYLDFIKEFPISENGLQTIEFGVNMLDLNDHITAENVYTVIIPLGAQKNGSRVNISTVNNGSDMLENTSGINMFGRIVRAVEFDDQTDPQALKETAQNALSNAVLEALTINIDALDLSIIGNGYSEMIAGKYVRVKSDLYGSDSSVGQTTTVRTVNAEVTYVHNQYCRYTDGAIYTDSGSLVSNYIPIPDGVNNITIKGLGRTLAMGYFFYTNENVSYGIEGSGASMKATDVTEFNVSVPSGAKYVVFTTRVGYELQSGVSYEIEETVSTGDGTSVIMLCTESTIDMLHPENSRFTIGSTFGTLTDTQNKNWNKLRNNIYLINGLGARVTTIEESENDE